ncbi:MAG: glycosyltransferase family 2 protein [Reichenbachiella sp.]
MAWIIISIYILSLLFIFMFSLGQLHLTWVYLRTKKLRKTPVKLSHFPTITVQLPIFNEKYVAERLIDCIAQLEYPHDKLEIQVLDDSTDETIEIISRKIKCYLDQGIDIHHIRRNDRRGFKAGALAYGNKIAKGEFMAIFDADFIPEKDFLLNTVSYFDNPEVGCVQTRWGHINKDYSMLTKLQAFGLDAHFTVEQSGRNLSRSFMNFNGTAGVWRKTCIEEAGGWSAETLTEDLDLSYRAQLKGWKFKYAEDVVAPAELPVIMSAIKSQQYRWNKGAAQTAKKNLLNVLKSPYNFRTKVHAFFHLLNSSVFLSLIIAAVMSIPLLMLKSEHIAFETLFSIGRVFLIGFFSISIFYFVGTKAVGTKDPIRYFLKNYPLFLFYSMGLSLHNAIAVAEGLFGKKSPFIRTPKFNIKNRTDKWNKNQYVQSKLTWPTALEGLLAVYFIGGVVIGLMAGDFILIIFHTMLALGFGIIFFHSLVAMKHA